MSIKTNFTLKIQAKASKICRVFPAREFNLDESKSYKRICRKTKIIFFAFTANKPPGEKLHSILTLILMAQIRSKIVYFTSLHSSNRQRQKTFTKNVRMKECDKVKRDDVFVFSLASDDCVSNTASFLPCSFIISVHFAYPRSMSPILKIEIRLLDK